jgi:hypothetical protein
MVSCTIKKLGPLLAAAVLLCAIACPSRATVLDGYRGDYPDMEPVIVENGDAPPMMTIPRFDSAPAGDSGDAPAPINNLPEPSSALLISAGMAALGLSRRSLLRRAAR